MSVKLVTLWVEGPLAHLERICLASMLAQGHEVELYTYGEVTNAPRGLQIRDAAQILPFDANFCRATNPRRRRDSGLVLLSDYFRLVLQQRDEGVWVDTDCFLLRPIEVPSHGYLMGYEKNTINGAVLRLPAGSSILADMLAACQVPHKSPYWLDFRRKHLKRLGYFLSGRPWNLGAMDWGIIGPVALTRLVPRYCMEERVCPMKTFYPLDREGSSLLYHPGPFRYLVEDSEIRAIHVYDKSRKHLAPLPGSFMEWATNKVADWL